MGCKSHVGDYGLANKIMNVGPHKVHKKYLNTINIKKIMLQKNKRGGTLRTSSGRAPIDPTQVNNNQGPESQY